jgi:cytochrome P450
MPLVGELWAFLDDRIGFIQACARRSDATRIRLGPRRALVLNHPELIREVFVREAKHFSRGITGTPMRRVLGEGLLLSEGEVWRRQRRDVQPLFATQRIACWLPSIAAAAEGLISRWHDGEVRDIHHEMHRLTLDVAARVFLGIESDREGRLHPTLEAVLRQDMFPATIPLGPLRWPIRTSAATRALDDLVNERIAAASAPGGSPFIAALAETARDHREVRDQLTTLLFTAQDTTAVAFTWFWHLVSRDARVESAVREEADAARPYLAAALNETLRLYPPVIGQARETAAPCEIAGVSLRPHDLVLFSQWVVHRDVRWFERPAAFAPERWLGGLEDRLHPFAYFPFGGGRRVCVGRALAIAIGRTVIPVIARRFAMRARDAAEPRVHAVITPRPRDGLPMVLRAIGPRRASAGAVPG